MKSTRTTLSPKLSARKRRIFLVITVALPFVAFILVEFALRVIGYGPDLSLFTTETLAGKTYTVMNPAVKSRYFSRVAFNPSTSPDYFSVPKPQGTFRIFCLGGSTTVGYPYWYNGSFSSFLRDRLRATFPDRQIEIINVGMTATNSFTVNDMAEELIDYEPDLFIVYDGHNEFYGALGVSSNESLGSTRWLTKLYLKAIHLKTFLLFRDLFAGIRIFFSPEPSDAPAATMMEKLAAGQFIPHDSELYRTGLEAYKANLDDLKSLCSSHGIPLLLGSQVSNLRDLPPFVSQHLDGFPTRDSVEFKRHYDYGMQEYRKGNIDIALKSFERSLELDGQRADAHFQRGKCLDSLGRDSEARQAYVKARDYDQLRFRMSSDFNNAMHEICTDTRTVFVDMEKMFMANSPDSLVGHELIVEHLHPNSWGFFLMGKEYARAMREHGILASREEWRTRDTLDEDTLWSNRCVTDFDELLAMRRTEILTAGWPFTTQPPIVTAVAPDDTLGLIVEQVTRAQWNWSEAHHAAADYYWRRADWENAIRELRTIINQLPLLEEGPYLKLARIYLNQSRFEDAAVQLKASLAIKPTILAYRALGDLSLNSGRPAEAVSYYERTFSFSQTPPEQVENGYLLALALSRANNVQRASAELLKVLNIKPDYQPAAELLARMNSGSPR